MAPPLGPDIVPGGNQDWQFVRYDFQAFYHVIGFQNDDCCNYQIFSCFGDSDSDLIFCKKCTWAHTCQFEESVAPSFLKRIVRTASPISSSLIAYDLHNLVLKRVSTICLGASMSS